MGEPIDQARTAMLEHAFAERPHRQPMNAKCRQDACGHEWAVCYLPMPLEAAARCMKRAICPMCADERPLVGGMGGHG